MISEKHWNNLYNSLRECFYSCKENKDDIYSVKIGIILDHMNENKLYVVKK